MHDIQGAVPPTFAEKDLNYYLRMIRGDFAELEEQEPQMVRVASAPSQKNIVILLSSTAIGTGNEELGKRLLRHFLEAVGHNRVKPRAVILVNSAVHLAVEEGEILHKLMILQEQGIKILVCVLSADEYKVEEQLKVGSVADMDAIAEHLLSAWKVMTF